MTMTADGTVTGATEKKMAGFVVKTVGAKEASPADTLYDFTLVKKAHLALQAKGWQRLPRPETDRARLRYLDRVKRRPGLLQFLRKSNTNKRVNREDLNAQGEAKRR